MSVMTIGEARDRWPPATGVVPWQECWRWYCDRCGVVAFSQSDEAQMQREHGPHVPLVQTPKKWLEGEPPPTQEADGHYRGCARLGKCHCPASAPRDPFFCEHSERPEACWPCKARRDREVHDPWSCNCDTCRVTRAAADAVPPADETKGRTLVPKPGWMKR